MGVDDLVDVAVWKDPALSATVPVRPDGKISLPMVGEVVAVGRTPRDLETELRDKLKVVIDNPTVTVMLKESHSGRFFVLGEVAHPGAYPLTGKLNVIQAMALAGGPTEFARRGRVVVIRMAGARDAQRYKVNYDDVVKGEAPPISLVAGDTIFVP